MIEVLTQRPIPPGFDIGDDELVRRHAGQVEKHMAAVSVKMHWMRTYVTEDSIFGVVAFDSEGDLKAFRLSPAIPALRISVHRITRTIDPSGLV